jgi:hypothetical protein
MSKLLTLLMAGTAALTISACGTLWDRDDDSQQPTGTTESDTTGTTQSDTTGTTGTQGTGQTSDPSAQGTGQTGDTSSQGTGQTDDTQAGTGDAQTPQAAGDQPSAEEAFAEAVRQCESMSGVERENCVDKAKRDHGQM